MTWTSPKSGLAWPAGSDFVSSEPAIWQALDAQLARSVHIDASSVTDRDAKVPSPGPLERYTVRIASVAETHVWDGRAWIIYDDRPKLTKQDAGGKYWYSGTSSTPLDIGSGMLEIRTQRMGRYYMWSVFLDRASDSNRGGAGDYYSWWLPGVGSDWPHMGFGSGWAYYQGTEMPVTPRVIAAGHVVAIKGNGQRFGEGDLSDSANDDGQLAMGFIANMGGYAL